MKQKKKRPHLYFLDGDAEAPEVKYTYVTDELPINDYKWLKDLPDEGTVYRWTLYTAATDDSKTGPLAMSTQLRGKTLELNCATCESYAYQILNTKGQNVLTGNFNEDIVHLDVSHLPVGIYFIQVTDRENKVQKAVKVVIIH